jgi:hypothetical protein
MKNFRKRSIAFTMRLLLLTVLSAERWAQNYNLVSRRQMRGERRNKELLLRSNQKFAVTAIFLDYSCLQMRPRLALKRPLRHAALM